MDESRFDAAWRRYGDDVLRLAYFYLGNREQAEDVTQDVFVRFFTKGDSVDSKKEKAWLMVSTVNRCRDIWRSSWFRRVLKDDTILALIPAKENDVLEQREEKEAVLRAVHRLSPEFRDVVLLFYYQEMTIESIAEALSISKGTVASRLARGRDKVKKMLREEGYDG